MKAESAKRVDERIGRIAADLHVGPPLCNGDFHRAALPEAMEKRVVPGLSVAVIANCEIEWARGYGVREMGREDPVTTETLFQAASISKPVDVVAALQLRQNDREILAWKTAGS